MIKQLFIKFWHWIRTPHRIRKVKDTASFLKKCEYHQKDIEYLFKKKIFEDWSGHAEIHRAPGANISDGKVFIKRLM